MKKAILLFIVLLSVLTTYKSYVAYTAFSNNNAPVYDGVMYESRQIKTYMRFNNNFSLLERYNQILYEFEGNEVSAGFGCLIALINPNWFINDGDIIVRSFLSVLLFCFVFFHYLKRRTSIFNACLILVLIFQLPLFYHYRYGLTTYVPEIPSALLLLAGFIQFLNFFKTEKLLHCITALILVVIPIMFRFNFFVYAFCFMIPLLYKSFMIIKRKSKKEIVLMLGFVLLLLLFLTFYIFSHLSFFLNYYGGAIGSSIAYAKVDLSSSFEYLFIHLKEELGLLGFVTLFYLLLMLNENRLNENKMTEALYLVYPFLFFFSFIILYLCSTNVPHIIAAMVVFSLTVFFVPFNFIQNLVVKIKPNIIKYGAVLLIVVLNIGYVSSLNSFSTTSEEHLTHRKVIDFVSKQKELNSNFKYIGFYDEMIENQVDVSVFNKTGIWLNSTTNFFMHDLYLASMSSTLNPVECANFYIDKIETEKFNVIFINKDKNVPMASFKVACKVDKLIYNSLLENDNYQMVETIKSRYHGDVLVFQRKKGV